MRGLLYAFALVGLLVAGVIVWLELGGDDDGPTAKLPEVAEEPAGDAAPEAEPAETAPAEEDDAGDAPAQEAADDPAVSAEPERADLPAAEAGPLPAAPMAKLSESGLDGRIPRIAEDSTLPWRAYAKPFDNPAGKPVVAVVVTNLGLKRDVTAQAIDTLPGSVSLVFSPYADGLEQWADRARRAGHETLVAIPQEPGAFPANDPGDKALLVDLPASELSLRLRWSLSRFAGYAGGAGFMGERFVASSPDVRRMMRELGARGLMYLDTVLAPDSTAREVAAETGVPYAEAALRIDDTLTPSAIDAKLAEATVLAMRDGSAVALAGPYPISIERIALWADSLEAVVLAPVSAAARPRPTE